MNRQSPSGATPLFLAAQDGHDEIVALLLQNGADLERPAGGGWRPLHVAAKGGYRRTAELLLSKGANPNATSDEGGTPLHSAAQGGSTEMVKLLVDQGASVDAQFRDYVTPLHVAIERRNFAAADILVKLGAPVSLHLAAALGDTAVLINHLHKEDANEQDPTGNSALHFFAGGRGGERTGELLLAAGANINAANHDGATPLHFAVSFQNWTATEFLLKNGADPEALDSHGNTPLSLAGNSDDSRIRELGDTTSKE